MGLDARYIPITFVNQFFIDKDSGLPLVNGELRFFRDSARITPKEVFQLTGAPPNYTYTPLPNPVPLNGVGTVDDGAGNNVVIYVKPYDPDNNLDLYYMEAFKSGGTIPQWTREGFPNLTDANNPLNEPFPISNQIANPQFTRIFFSKTESNTYSVTAATKKEFRIAPDWSLEVTGTGSVTVQRIPIAGSENIITSPAFVLDISVSSGITECFLRQRMKVNSGLWASTNNDNIVLGAVFLARNENVGQTALTMFYLESQGGSAVEILSGSFDNSTYSLIKGATGTPTPFSNNTDLGDDGFIDIYFALAQNQHVRISSVQVIPLGDSLGTDLIEYDNQSSNREQALMGDYFIPALENKTTPNILTGWDFPINPAQFSVTGSIPTDPSLDYIWDQTLATRHAGSAITYSRNSATGGLSFLTGAANRSFYIQQYLDGQQVKKLIGTRLAVNVHAWKSAGAGDVTMRIYLLRATSAATFPVVPANLGTLAMDGEFTLTASGWFLIDRNGLDVPKVVLTTAVTLEEINTDTDYMFNNWEIDQTADINDTDKFAIIVTFGFVSTATDLTVQSINLVPGDIASRPASKSFAETVEDCQFYYEKSYDNSVLPGTPGAPSDKGKKLAQQYTDWDSPFMIGYSASFETRFNTLKRFVPTVDFYSPDSGTLGNVRSFLRKDGANVSFGESIYSGFWTLGDIGEKGAISIANNVQMQPSAVTLGRGEMFIEYHYTADARIGKV